MIYRKRIRKTGYGVRLLTQYIKLEFGKRVLYLPFDLGLGKPFGSLRALLDTKRGELVVHNRRRDMITVPRDASGMAGVFVRMVQNEEDARYKRA